MATAIAPIKEQDAQLASNGVAMPPDALAGEWLYRLSVEQYHNLIEADILTEDEPIELLDGILVQKMSKGPKHSAVTRRIQMILFSVLPQGWHIGAQDPITVQHSEPEPDIFLVRGDEFDYLDHHPTPSDIGLVIEVADSSLARDRTWKRSLYARAGVAVYWIVNLPDAQVEVFTEPTQSTGSVDYRTHKIYRLDDELPVQLDGDLIARLPVRDLLP